MQFGRPQRQSDGPDSVVRLRSISRHSARFRHVRQEHSIGLGRHIQLLYARPEFHVHRLPIHWYCELHPQCDCNWKQIAHSRRLRPLAPNCIRPYAVSTRVCQTFRAGSTRSRRRTCLVCMPEIGRTPSGLEPPNCNATYLAEDARRQIVWEAANDNAGVEVLFSVRMFEHLQQFIPI